MSLAVPPLTLARWAAALARQGLVVLPQSHAVPVSLWLRDHLTGEVLHFTARGTTLRLRVHDAADLAVTLLRSECDCEAHRQAGATGRYVVSPGATPVAELEVDGAAAYGWTGHQAALLPLDEAAAHLEALLVRRTATAESRRAG